MDASAEVTNDEAAVEDAGTKGDDEDEVVTVHLVDEEVDREWRILVEEDVHRSTLCLCAVMRSEDGQRVDPA